MAEFFSENSFIIAQVFGFCAMLTAVIMYQFNKHRTILLLMMLCSALWCCHYAFLGLYSAVAMNVVNIIRNLVFRQRTETRLCSDFIPAAFIAASAVLVILTWNSPWSLLPLVGSIFSTLAGWQKTAKRLRILTVPVCLCWLTYNIFNQSWAGTCNEIFALGSIFTAMIRYDRKKGRTS